MPIRLRSCAAIAAALLSLAAPRLRAQDVDTTGDLAGTVRDPEGYPVPHAEVLLADGRWRAVTDGQGTYLFRGLPAGTWALRVRRLGYLPASDRVSIVAGRDHLASTVMEHLPATVLRTITVTSRNERDRFRGMLAGARAASRWSAEALGASGVYSLRDFLRSRESSAQAVADQRRWVAAVGTNNGSGGEACALSPFATGCGDASFFYQNDQTGRRADVVSLASQKARTCAGYDVYVNGQRSPEWLLDALDPADLDGVDYARYGASGSMLGTCATIAVWTKAPMQETDR